MRHLKSLRGAGFLTACAVFYTAGEPSMAQDYLEQLKQRLGVPAATNAESQADNSAGEPEEILPPPILSPLPDDASEAYSNKTPPPVPSPPKGVVGSGAEPRAGAAPSPFDVPAAGPVAELVPESSASAAVARDRPYIGMKVQPRQGGSLGLEVLSVVKDSPAWKAGLTAGDILLAVDQAAVADLDQLAGEIYGRSVGEVTRFLIERGGRSLTLVVVLGSANLNAAIEGRGDAAGMNLSDSVVIDPQPSRIEDEGQRPRVSMGVTVEPLNDSYRRQLRLPVVRGALVTEVFRETPAEAAGLKVGDCIVEIDGDSIQSNIDLFDYVMQLQPGDVASVRFYRGPTLMNADIRFTPASGIDGGRPTRALPADPQKAQQVMELRRQIDALQQQLDAIAP